MKRQYICIENSDLFFVEWETKKEQANFPLLQTNLYYKLESDLYSEYNLHGKYAVWKESQK